MWHLLFPEIHTLIYAHLDGCSQRCLAMTCRHYHTQWGKATLLTDKDLRAAPVAHLCRVISYMAKFPDFPPNGGLLSHLIVDLTVPVSKVTEVVDALRDHYFPRRHCFFSLWWTPLERCISDRALSGDLGPVYVTLMSRGRFTDTRHFHAWVKELDLIKGYCLCRTFAKHGGVAYLIDSTFACHNVRCRGEAFQGLLESAKRVDWATLFKYKKWYATGISHPQDIKHILASEDKRGIWHLCHFWGYMPHSSRVTCEQKASSKWITATLQICFDHVAFFPWVLETLALTLTPTTEEEIRCVLWTSLRYGASWRGTWKEAVPTLDYFWTRTTILAWKIEYKGALSFPHSFRADLAKWIQSHPFPGSDLLLADLPVIQ